MVKVNEAYPTRSDGTLDIDRWLDELCSEHLHLDPETPLLVGHTPLSEDDTLWLNANDIPNHHVLFGAHSDWVGVVVQTDDRLLPLRYPAEPMLELINRARKDNSSD